MQLYLIFAISSFIPFLFLSTVTKHPTGNGTHNVDGSVISTTTQPDSGYIALIVIGSLLGSSLVMGVVSIVK